MKVRTFTAFSMAYPHHCGCGLRPIFRPITFLRTQPLPEFLERAYCGWVMKKEAYKE